MEYYHPSLLLILSWSLYSPLLNRIGLVWLDCIIVITADISHRRMKWAGELVLVAQEYRRSMYRVSWRWLQFVRTPLNARRLPIFMAKGMYITGRDVISDRGTGSHLWSW